MADRQAIFILGMGRSGTSALARVLSLCGAALPEALLGPDEGNPTGYWEPLDALRLNDNFLFRHGATWFDPTLRIQSEIPFADREREDYIEQIRIFLSKACPGKPVVVVKEPRITALADFWFEGASRAGFSTRIVIPVRHPGEVAESLAVHCHVSAELSALLWLKYNLLAEAKSRSLPRIFVEYPNLLSDWRREIARISGALSLDLSEADEARIDAFLSPNLHRQRNSSPAARVFSQSWNEEVYTAFSAAARGAPFDTDAMDKIFSTYEECERMFRVSLEEFRNRFGPPGAAD